MFLVVSGKSASAWKIRVARHIYESAGGSEAMEFSGGLFVGREWELDVGWRRLRPRGLLL